MMMLRVLTFPAPIYALGMLPWLASRAMRTEAVRTCEGHNAHGKQERGMHEAAAAASRRKKIRTPVNREREFGKGTIMEFARKRYPHFRSGSLACWRGYVPPKSPTHHRENIENISSSRR
jgi:hypothetical protein